MKVRFYCNVPEYSYSGMSLYAYMEPSGVVPSPGYRRVAFDVELPIKEADIVVDGVSIAEPHGRSE
jgi:hypothetical protein